LAKFAISLQNQETLTYSIEKVKFEKGHGAFGSSQHATPLLRTKLQIVRILLTGAAS